MSSSAPSSPPSQPVPPSPPRPPLVVAPPSLHESEQNPDDAPHDSFIVDDSSSDEAIISTQNDPDEPSVSVSADSCSGDDALCVVCFERPPEVTLEPCGHSNLCLTCLSRLVKRRCPTCRARAKKVRTIDEETGETITRTVRDVIADRKRAENDILSSTLQIVFLGPPSVGKKALVRKLLSQFPLTPPTSTNEDIGTTVESTNDYNKDEALFSDGTNFAANARMGGSEVRLSVLRRTSLVSRRMMLDDVRLLKPDVLVLCCSAHTATTFDELQAWDRVLRSAFARSRVWALLADDDDTGDLAADAAAFHLKQSVPATISAISPPELRPRGHYLCTRGPAFNIGFRSLVKDVVEIARVARDEQFAAALAAEEVRNIAAHHAAGTLADQQHAASLVIANNGIPVPAFAHVSAASPLMSSRAQTAETRPTEGNRTSFGIRGLRSSRENTTNGSSATETRASEANRASFGIRGLRSTRDVGANGNNGTFSLGGIVKWFSGASGGAQ